MVAVSECFNMVIELLLYTSPPHFYLINKSLKRTFIAVLGNNMEISSNIKRIREVMNLSQKEAISAIGIGAAQYSCIENGNTNPPVSTLVKLAKALGVHGGAYLRQQQPTMDKTLMERVSLIDSLTKEEQRTLFAVLDAFVAKRKFKSSLKTVLQDIE